MNTPPPRHDPRQTPLDSDERALAEALARVPASEPGPELDARVLGMARDAVQPRAGASSRRRRPHRLSWIGTAAGAVLAVGIGWQLSQTEHGQQAALQPAPASAPQMHDSAATPSLDVEVIRRPAPPASPSPQAADPSAAAKAVAESIGAARSVRAEDASANEIAPRRRQSEARMEAEAAPAMLASPPPPIAPDAPDAPEPASAPAGSAQRAAQAPADSGPEALERIQVTGSRIRRGETLDADGFPPIAQDARLQPREWIERIRARRAAGQDEAARRSLEDFARSYPYLLVPDDLRPLLSEAQ